MTNYIPYSYNAEFQPGEPTPSNSSSQRGLISMTQQEPTRSSTPPKSPPSPSRSTNFTTSMFHSNPYPMSMRRRKTEPIFSFESGPTFSTTIQHVDLLSMDQTNSYQVQLYAKMDRGFFKAEQDWTCYRRNYFQVSSSFDVVGLNYSIKGSEVPCLLRQQEQLIQVDYFSIGITARVTSNDKKIELVQHTPKRDKGPQIIPEPRPLRAGGNLHLAPIGPNNNIVTFERLQFKTATANNGKRRAAQQYYEIVVDLYANSSHTPPICVATCTSAPLVVRGRSPGHYADSHTRFKHMDAESSTLLDRTPSIFMAAKNKDTAFPSPSHNHPSLPNSPMSELGPYSPYSGYPYSSFMPPPTTYQQHYTTTPSAGGSVSTPYFENPPQMYSDKPNFGGMENGLKNESQNSYFVQEMQYNNSRNTMYMTQDPYNRSHNEDASSYSSSHDAFHS